MSATFTELVTLVKMECSRCGGIYAITESKRIYHKENGGYWNCPYCQAEWGYQESELQQLRKALDDKSRALTASRCETLKERQLKEEFERKLSRVKNGVCPCCKRSFTNLRRHIASKHPELNANA